MITHILLGFILIDLLFITLMLYAIGEKLSDKKE